MKLTNELRFIKDGNNNILQQKWVSEPEKSTYMDTGNPYEIGDKYWDDSVIISVELKYQNIYGKHYEIYSQEEEWKDVPFEAEIED